MIQKVKHRKSLRKGFSLIEIMIVIGIAGIVLGGVIYTAMTVMAMANRSTTKTNMQTIKSGLMSYKQEKGEYPKTLNDLAATGILKPLPKDGWNKPFVYRATPEGKNPYELFSYGPDGKSGGKASRIDVWTTKG